MSLTLDPRTTALVLIDLQNGVISMPLAPHSAQQVVDRCATLARRLAAAGAAVVLVRVAFSENSIDRLKQPVDSPSKMPTSGLPPEFFEFAESIQSLPADVVITKRQWGAFHGTELDLQLRRRGINTIVLGGIATNFGVESTAREAWQDNYSVIIAEDACSSMSDEMHRFSIEKVLPRISRVRSTDEILAALSPS